MSTRTRRAARALAALALLSVAAVVPAARAQGASATLTLERQTPWGTLVEPAVTKIDIAVNAANTGETPIEDLAIRLNLGSEVRSRGAFDEAMQPGGPPLTVLYALTRPQEGALAPGQTRTFEVGLDLGAIPSVSKTESLIYPLQIDLLSGETPLAELRTPVLFFFQEPQQPISFAWTVELSPPVGFAPSGELVDEAAELTIEPGGRIFEQLTALTLLADNGTPVNLALSPLLVDTLQRMAAGYRVEGREVPAGEGGAAAAQEALDRLGHIVAAPNVEVSAYAFAAPQLPAMLQSGLGRDLDGQTLAGDELLASSLDLTPQTTVARAPAGALDGGAVQHLANAGATILLADADTVDRPAQPLDFAPLPTGALDRPGGGDPVALVLPDPGAQAVLGTGAASDPVLTAQQTLGALAAVWQEAPVPDEPRGVAVSLTEELALPAAFWEPFARRMANAPFLDPIPARDLVDRMPPGDPAELAAPSTTAFSAGYAETLKQEGRRVDALRSMLAADGDLPARLERALLYAEAGQYVGNEAAGLGWIGAVHAQTEAVFAAAAPEPNQDFTLTYRAATIPLLIGGSDGPPLDVTVELQSPQLRFPDGAVQDVRIEGVDQVVIFDVEATGAGQIPLQVIVRAPNGRILSETTLAVRSTAYNRIALVITGAAALALVALWVRRLIARRRTT